MRVDPRRDRFHRGVHRGAEFVGIIQDVGEGRQRLEAERPPSQATWCPHHDLGVRQVLIRSFGIVAGPGGRRRWPGSTEPRQVVVGVKHDR
jgi:hypothetical protein